MCTQTDSNIQNENIESSEPRNINVLLALETYQGMTDVEIELVLNYKVQQALTSQEILLKTAAETTRMEQCIADNQASSQRALDLIESLIGKEFPTLPVEQPRTFVARSLEV